MSLSEVRENVIFAKHDKNRDNAFWTGLSKSPIHMFLLPPV